MLREIFGFVEEEFPCKIVEESSGYQQFIRFKTEVIRIPASAGLSFSSIEIYDHTSRRVTVFDLKDPKSIDEMSELVRGILNEYITSFGAITLERTSGFEEKPPREIMKDGVLETLTSGQDDYRQLYQHPRRYMIENVYNNPTKTGD